MAASGAAKAAFAIAIAASVLSIAVLGYLYIGGGQEAYTGDQDVTGDVAPADDQDDVRVDLAPDFYYQAVDGGSVSLSGARGKVVVLDFMATWCSPCRTQIQNLDGIHAEYSAKGVVFISLDVDTRETAAELLAFRGELGAQWHFALDADGVGSSPEYSASSIPTMVFIDRQGEIAYRDVGVMDEAALRAAIDPLL